MFKQPFKITNHREHLQEDVNIRKSCQTSRTVIKRIDFPLYMFQFCEKILMLLHISENYVFGASEINNPISDPKSGCR